MVELSLSASLVVYKPDLAVLEGTLLALHHSVQQACEHHKIYFELTIVDNSCDAAWWESLQAWAHEQKKDLSGWPLRLLQSPGNIGYGRANNLVIERAESDYHLVINPDLFVEPDAIAEALHFMGANLDVGLLTPAVAGEEGERHYLCKRNPTLFIMFLRGFAPAWLKAIFRARLDAFEMRDHDYNAQIDAISFPTGCFMFFRTSFLRQVHGFDPDFFMYLEDADIGRRVLEVARVVYVPAVKVVHQWARGSHRSWRLRWVTIQSAFIYWKKWGGVF